LRRYFAAIQVSEKEVLAVVQRMELDPQLANAVAKLQSAEWRVVVTSAGCDWYIRRLLDSARVHVEVHANPGRFETGKGLVMEMPPDSPFWSPTLGVDKTAIVRGYLNEGIRVAFAGDGFPDAEPARLVPASLRFARGDLAEALKEEHLPFQSFATWSDIADHVMGQET
jgi:2-hydroxy-3-keto-5-methylthiopentenyl-1-phosphate phosphatase